MRIGIVTQPLCANYGGILQNLALQTVLKEMGHNPITLDLCTHLNVSKTEYIKGYIINIIKNIIRGENKKYLSYYQKRPQVFDEFVTKYIETTEPIDSYTEDLIDRYKLDCIIVGSDQVWRPRFNVFPHDMFLAFTSNRDIFRLSYAASFGTDKWEFSADLTKKCAELISSFARVSVREESGVELCKQFLKHDAEVVIDPTLLIQQDFYNSLCQNIPKQKEKFVAVYALNISKNMAKQIYLFASELGLNVKMFTSDANYTLSVSEWLSVFRDASFVITDSFHGTAFSIIYNKNFISVSNGSRGASRFTSLLGQVGLEDRLVKEQFPEYSIFKTKIDWHKVNEKRENLINKSLLFLQHTLQ